MSPRTILESPDAAILSLDARRGACALLVRQPLDGLPLSTARAVLKLSGVRDEDGALSELRAAGWLVTVWEGLEPCEAAPEGLHERVRVQTPAQREAAAVFAESRV